MSQEEEGRKTQSMILSPESCIWDLSFPGNGNCLTPEKGLGSGHFGSWEVLEAGCPLSWPTVGTQSGAGPVLAENLPEAQPESARSGLGAFRRGPSRSSRASDGPATSWASAAQALSLVPWHDACPSLPGYSFPWH